MSDDVTAVDEEEREVALITVQRFPNRYLRLAPEFKSDAEICDATLYAFCCYDPRFGLIDRDDNHLAIVLEEMLQHLPDFSHHKQSLWLFLEKDYMRSVGIYLARFGPEIIGNRTLLIELIHHDHKIRFFERLPLELRSDIELQKIAVERVHRMYLSNFLRAIPMEALEEHEFFIVFRGMEREYGLSTNSGRIVPRECWQRKNFILKWTERKVLPPLHLLPIEFREDREICLALCRQQPVAGTCRGVCEWIPTSLLSDKRFILDCLNDNPKIFEYCHGRLQRDFDVVLGAAIVAIRLNTFDIFMRTCSLHLAYKFIKELRSRLEARDEFTTFLACSWKSRQLSLPHLSFLDCDEETARGFKTMIAQYLGFSNTEQGKRLKQVMDKIVVQVVQRSTEATSLRAAFLARVINPRVLAQGILKAIECHHPVTLQTFPDELWSSRVFVRWAASMGKFHKAIPEEFSFDPDICIALCQHCPADRNKILPWISDSLKSDRLFVMKCADVDPLILNFCTKVDIRYDFDVVLKAVYRAVAQNQLDDLVEAALESGWADALVVFAKSLRAKLEAHRALDAFSEETRAQLSRSITVRRMIGCYLDIRSLGNEYKELQFVWQDRMIFHLALGGSIEELWKAFQFREEKQPASKFPAKKRRIESSNRAYESFDDDI